MKRYFNFAFAGAIALTGSTMLTSCSSSDDAAAENNNPNYDPDTQTVYAQFVFNVSTGNQATTRQSSAATQATTSETFRGINNAGLFTYKLTNDGKHLAEAAVANKFIDLGTPLASGTIDDTHSHRVLEMSLPINTNTMLFYGKAPEGTASSAEAQLGYSAYDLYGHLDDYTLAGGTGDNAGKDISAANFELGKRMTADNKAKYDEIKKLLGGVLTCIINTKIAGTDHVALDAEHYGVAVAANEYPATVTWANYANADGKSPVETTHEPYSLEVKLAEVYKALTTIQTSQGELRAGYGTAILHTIEDVWSVINSVQCATPFSKGEAVAKKLAELIHVEINKYFDGSVPMTGDNKGGAVTGVAFKPVSTMATTFNTDGLWPTTTAGTHPTVAVDGIGSEDLSKFPMAYAVPSGAAHYDWDGTKKIFEYVTNYNTSSVGGASGFTVESYLYPAELLYFGNSPLRVSGTEHKEPTYPNGVDKWKDNTEWSSDWVNNSHVVSTTKSVAMRNNINYGSALLKTTVGYKSATLKDNNHAIQKAKDPSIGDTDEPDKEITVSATSFQLVGVIIGGQYKKVGWDFTPKTTGNTQGYIYDKAIPDGANVIPAYNATPAASNPNYTLVFDNYNAGQTAANQDKVYVALELKNNTGQDFYGKHNLIRAGDSFYLVGKLDPTTISWSSLGQLSTDHPLPPYDTDGSSIETVRVFMQDFMTTANFWFDQNSLKQALLTVPDLRHSSLTLGLSVDMRWSTGINFSNVILGQ